MVAIAAGWLLAAAAGASNTALSFAPYAFQTQKHGVIDAEVAYLSVPERHANPSGPTRPLRVVRLKAVDGSGGHAPVVYLAGGPGGSGVGTARGDRWPVFDQVRQHTDVLLFDQRGTGESQPPPACPHGAVFDDAQPLQRDTALTALQAHAVRCISWWQQQGVDLGSYTSEESADDIAALRQAMGVPRISLWGMSYGTHLALATVRRHGEGIERAVLFGAEGPDDTLKLPSSADALLAQLAPLAARDGFEDLVGSAGRVITALEQQPATGRSLIHQGRQVTLGAFDAQLAIAAAIGRRSSQQMLPLALRDAEQGNYDLLAALVLSVREGLQAMSAMPLAMDAASGASPQRRALVAEQAGRSLLGEGLVFPLPALSDDLGLVRLGEDYRAPLHSTVPMLLISGTLDGRTPAANADALMPGLANAVHQQVIHASHDDELWLGNAAIGQTVADFLAGRPVAATNISVPAPVFARDALDLIAPQLGISRGGLIAALVGAAGGLLALLLGTVWLLRRWWKKRRNLRAGAAQRR